MKKILITGGCGFIGANAVEFYLKRNYQVIAIDNLSRVGSKQNLKWLKSLKGEFVFKKLDIRNYKSLLAFFTRHKPERILHLAGQTTLTDSVIEPREDFEVNALGTFNVLEAIRKTIPKAYLIYSSTNKVMGELVNIPIKELKSRYAFKNVKGISETHPLNFCGPYGCSKGCGDQYVLDYARIYKLNTIVFRLSCIYGSRQFGIEGQGWLSWFIKSLFFNSQLTIYGNGKQVRDVLHIDDLIIAFELAFKYIRKTKGKAYTIGGGSNATLSLIEFINILEKKSGKKFNLKFKNWRVADQKVYISDLSSAKRDFDWTPTIFPKEGINRLYKWTQENINVLIS